MTLGPVIFTLPDAAVAPGYRDSLSSLSQFAVQDFGTAVAVEPREGAGATRTWFTAHRLCDDTTQISPDTWEPLRRFPPHEHDQRRRDVLNAYADSLVDAPPEDLARQLRGLSARVFGLGPQLPAFLHGQMPRLFPNLPGGSLWYVSTDNALLARFAFLRSQLALRLTPDIPLHRGEFEGLHLLGAHSLTQGTDFARLFQLPGLIFSPALTALVMSCPPHALVLFFGASIELRRNVEDSFNDLFFPRVLDRAVEWTDSAFWEGLAPADVESLLPWWTDRLNVLFSHAADPTRFADALGHHDPAAQTAWHLTLERALADATLVLADPSAHDLVRSQLAFDLLDKCESLLGYSKSGPGFKELMRRSKVVPRLNQAWGTLPGELPRRFRQHTRAVFDSFYEDVGQHGLAHRRTRRGMLIAPEPHAKPRPMSMDDYVSRIVREGRNSAHGLSRQLRGSTGMLVSTHDGDLPPQLTDVAKLALFGLVADADRLCAGSWW